MPTVMNCVSGKDTLQESKNLTQQVYTELRAAYYSSDRFPKWIKSLVVIPIEATEEGSFSTIPCVIVDLQKCSSTIIDSATLSDAPSNPNVTLTEYEAERLTRICYQRERNIVGEHIDETTLEQTAVQRGLLSMGVPLVVGRTTTGAPTRCIIPIIPNPDSEAGGIYTEDLHELAYAGVFQQLIHHNSSEL